MNTLDHARCVKVMDQLRSLLAVFSFEYQHSISWFVNVHLGILIYIAVSMTGNGDRFLPVLHTWLDSLYHNGSTKNSSIQDCTNSSVRAFVHFFQIILRHSGFIRGNGGTFNSNSVFLGGFRCIYSYLVISLISVFQSKIIVFCLQINKRKKKLILDQLPQNSGHLVPIHLNKRGLHLNFTHYYLLVYVLW